MKYKAWNQYLILIVLTSVFLIGFVNWCIDPFNIFQSNIFENDFQLNERFCKIKHLQKHHHRYNSYIFGSSRVASTPPQYLEKYLSSSRFYNMTVAGCSQYDNLLLLNYFIKNNYEIKTIYLQIDITDVNGFNPITVNQYAKHHPDTQNKSRAIYYSEYLTALPLHNIIGKLKINLSQNSTPKLRRFDVEGSGCWYLDEAEARINEHPGLYIKEESSFHFPVTSRALPGKYIDQNLSALKEIKKLAIDNGIQIIPFIPPYHHLMLDTFNIESYTKYLTQISEIFEYWDFSSYHPITFDNQYYYSKSYFRPKLVELILARIFHNTNIEIPENFGVFVTKKNIKEHIQAKIVEISKHENKSFYEKT